MRSAPAGARAVGIGELRGPGIPRAAAPRPGAPIRGRCGDAAVLVDGRARGAAAARAAWPTSSAGGPLRARGCRSIGARRRAAPARRRARAAAHGPPAPGLPGAAAARRGGRRARARSRPLRATARSRERASRSTGPPGWCCSSPTTAAGAPPATAATWASRSRWTASPTAGGSSSCREASFSFAPGGTVVVSYVISAIAALAARGPAPAGAPAGRRSGPEPAGPAPPSRPRAGAPLGTRRWRSASPRPWCSGFVFALRAGVVLGPLVALVLWRGIGARAARGDRGRAARPGGARDLPDQAARGPRRLQLELRHRPAVGAHWVAVAAVACAGLAAWRAAAEISRARSAVAPQAEHHRQLDAQVAREPRQLGELAAGVPSPLRAAQRHAPVARERPGAALEAEARRRRPPTAAARASRRPTRTSRAPASPRRGARARPSARCRRGRARSGARRPRRAGRPRPPPRRARPVRAGGRAAPHRPRRRGPGWR